MLRRAITLHVRPARPHCRRELSTNRAHWPLWIDNAHHEAIGGATLDIEDPATGETVATCAAADAADVDAAVKSGQNAWAGWRQAGVKQRGAVLRKAAALLRDALPELVDLETKHTGRPKREYAAQLGRVPEWYEYHAALAETSEGRVPPLGGDPDHLAIVRREPLGVCGLITPFNHPLLIASKKLAPCLATGNVAVVKAPELAPASVLRLAEIFADAGAPPGVVNVVPGEGVTAGAAVAKHPDVARVDFTGGPRGGAALGALAGARSVSFTSELGGHAPVLVFADADVDAAVAGACFAAFLASGQTCVSAKRILVADAIFEEFAEKFARRTDALRVGDPFESTTDVGPVVSGAALGSARAHVINAAADGASILSGGADPCDVPERLRNGHFLRPTILGGATPAMACFQDECFAPVVTLSSFGDEAEAVSLANANAHALGAGIWTKDVARAHRVAAAVNAGIVWVNAHHRNAPDAPWGGFLASGVGRENGHEAQAEYTAPKTVVIRTAAGAEDWFADSNARYG